MVRVHGGAIVASGVENLAYEARQLVAHDQKRLIGEAAARLIPDNSSLFINIGTTTEEVAKALSRHSGLLVITNNLHVASELHRSSAIEIFLTGGTVRQSDGGIVGAVTVEQIEQFRVDFAVIGTSAIDQTGTLLDFDIREVEISRAIVEHARKIILVSDSSKFSRSAPVRIAHLSEIDVFVTDRLPSPSDHRALRAMRSESHRGRRPGRSGRRRRARRAFTNIRLIVRFFACPVRYGRYSVSRDRKARFRNRRGLCASAWGGTVESSAPPGPTFDIAIIGGGVNGCGIARDAAGRGWSVYLCEKDDLASSTSSASSKLIHGGLRYLEHFEFRLVREALIEREVLWRIAPHIVWPLRFVLPHNTDLRPAWMLRIGLFLYDHLGGRQSPAADPNAPTQRRPGGRTAQAAVQAWVRIFGLLGRRRPACGPERARRGRQGRCHRAPHALPERRSRGRPMDPDRAGRTERAD